MVDTVESAADWCCEHWKLIVTIVIVVVAVALLWTGVGGVLLAGACWGALSGAVIGGVSGGLTSMANGGSFLEGFEDGAFSGALAGAICGAAFAGLGQLGAVCGKSIKCISPFGKAIRGTAAVTTAISIAMGSFDTLALADLAFGSGTIYDLNSKLHSNTAYNIFQTGVTALAVFTGGMTGTMKCFIAGTLIAIETGFAGIESIKPGDLVLSTNADTMESGYKKVLEKYVRKTRELVHIIAGGEEIVSTPDHPYYVAGRGFVNACQLCIGSPLLDADGRVLETEQIYKESLEEDEEVTVYNFQVEEWHTYHVGEMEVLVHNAEYETSYGKSSSNCTELVPYYPANNGAESGTPSGFYQDANGRWHRPNGDFASNAEVGIASPAKTATESHGNSLSDPRTNYGYVLVDKDTNEILKFGETLYPETRYSKSYLEQNNAVMKVLESGSKEYIHYWQYDMNKYFEYMYDEFPPLLKSKGW